jgi:hypothetical protein
LLFLMSLQPVVKNVQFIYVAHAILDRASTATRWAKFSQKSRVGLWREPVTWGNIALSWR